MKRFVVLAFSCALLVSAGVFAARNIQPLAIDFFLVEPEAPVIVWLVGAVVAGALLTALCFIPGMVRAAHQRRRLQRELRDARDECDRLRRASLQDR